MEARTTTRSRSGDIGTAVRPTPTQVKVLCGVRSGQFSKQTAHDLGIAKATVKTPMTALMRKLNARNRMQVAIAAQSLVRHLG